MIRVHLPYSKGYHVKKSPIALNLKAKPCIIGIDQKTAKKKKTATTLSTIKVKSRIIKTYIFILV